MGKYFGVFVVIIATNLIFCSSKIIRESNYLEPIETLETFEDEDIVLGQKIMNNPYYIAFYLRDRFRVLRNQIMAEVEKNKKELAADQKLTIKKCPGSSKYCDAFKTFTLVKFENITKWLAAEDNSDEPISTFEHETSFNGFKLVWQFEIKKELDFFVVATKIIGSSEEEVYFSNDIYLFGKNGQQIRKKEGPILREKVTIGLTWPLQLYIDSDMLRREKINGNNELEIVINQTIFGAEHLVYTKPLTEVPSTTEEFTFSWLLKPEDFSDEDENFSLQNQTKRLFTFEQSKWSVHLQLERASPHSEASSRNAVIEMHIRLLDSNWSEVFAKRKITKSCPPYPQMTENFEGRNYLDEEDVNDSVYKMDYRMSGRCSLILNFKILGKGTRLCDAIKKDSKRFQVVGV